MTRVLVVDDNSLNQKLMRLVLAENGYETRFVGSAEEVDPVLLNWRPDLILMDVQLPGMDGLELTRRLKGNPSTSGIRVVVITACAMQAEREEAAVAGCDAYVTKPIDTRTLPALIARWTGSAN